MKDQAEAWMRGYLLAWSTDAPNDIAALFTEDAIYRPGPFEEPWEGRDSIVREWIAAGDSSIEWSFEYEVVANEGGTFVIAGITEYPVGVGPTHKSAATYANVWIVHLAKDGRASEFTEYWMAQGDDSA
ncbi:MAG: nuclear transport factor 2 family protein [Actinomycetota bacterium]|nr:nuclear transport factor 2 family protein [Actinomycetota bacterium]